MNSRKLSNFRLSKFSGVFNIKSFYITKNSIIIIDDKNILKVIFDLKRKYILSKNYIKLDEFNKIFKVKDYRFFIIIYLHDKKFKITNDSLKCNLCKKENLTDMRLLKCFIILELGCLYEIYHKNSSSKIKLKNSFKNITYLKFFDVFMIIQYDYNKYIIYNINNFKIWNTTKILKTNDEIHDFIEYDTYLKFCINNWENNLILNKNTLKVTNFDIVNKNDVITNFKEYKNYINIEINDYAFLLDINTYNKINFNVCNQIVIIQFEEHKFLIKLFINLTEFLFYNKQNFIRVQFENVKITDKITDFIEYKFYLEIKINDFNNILFFENFIINNKIPIKFKKFDIDISEKLNLNNNIILRSNKYYILEKCKLKWLKLGGFKRNEEIKEIKEYSYFLAINTNLRYNWYYNLKKDYFLNNLFYFN